MLQPGLGGEQLLDHALAQFVHIHRHWRNG
jgi:hypothetical protein